MIGSMLVKLAYLVAAVLFILGLKWMSHPKTAVRANIVGAIGMAIAMIAACYDAMEVGERNEPHLRMSGPKRCTIDTIEYALTPTALR